MKTLRARFAALFASAAVVPLIIFGVVSVYSLREGTRRSVTEGNINVAKRAAGEIRRYVITNIEIFHALAADLQSTDLATWQQDRILKNYVLRFPEFRELTFYDRNGDVLATSRVGAPRVRVPGETAVTVAGTAMSPITIDDDLLPTTILTVRLERVTGSVGSLVGEFKLEEMWRTVDGIRVGAQGFALVVGENGELLAHGDPDRKAMVALRENFSNNPVVRDLRNGPTGQPLVRELDEAGRRMLTVGVAIPELRWMLLVEQPTTEAYATARRLERQLMVAISLVLLIMIGVGYAWGRSFIGPIALLIRATARVAEGRLDERVHVEGRDELGQLGDAFNKMADRLLALQEDVRKKERQAMFGRIAAGLVHDLSHPIQNIGNNAKLILKMYQDSEYRETFRRTVDRELATIKRMFEDLRNIARPIPLERFPVDVNKSIADVVDAMRTNAQVAGVRIDTALAEGEPYINGDVFALSRVYRNLLLNAIQATPPLGHITATTSLEDGHVSVTISDTGCGVPPERLATMFEDFVTTKRQGLGLGLAIAKKIVEQLGGTISVTSAVGKGTSFVLQFEAIQVPHVEMAVTDVG